MVRGSYVMGISLINTLKLKKKMGTSFVGVNSSESEDDIMKDVKERLTCPHL